MSDRKQDKKHSAASTPSETISLALAQHLEGPASMTHSGVARHLRQSEALIRISIGIENMEDLISDLAQGLEYVRSRTRVV
jgi:cystathionine beta-lyase/cystathionine gamma-synthase